MSISLKNKQIIIYSNSQKRNLKKILSGRELPYIYTTLNGKTKINESNSKNMNQKERNIHFFSGPKSKKLKLLLSPIEKNYKVKKFENQNIPLSQRRKCISPFHSKIEIIEIQKNNTINKERRNSTTTNFLKNNFKAASFVETQKKFEQNYSLFSNNYLFYYALLTKYNKEINDSLNQLYKDNNHDYRNYPSEEVISQLIKNLLLIYKGYFEITYKLFNGQNGNIFRDIKLFSIYTKLIKEQLIVIILLFLNCIFLSNEEFINNLNSGLYDIWFEVYILISNYYSNYIINLVHLSTKKERDVDLISLKKYYSNNFPPSKIKGEQYLNSIEKNTIRCLELIKNYIILTLNFSKLKGYSYIINYLLDSVDTKKLTFLVNYNIFYGELKSLSKHKKLLKINNTKNTINKNNNNKNQIFKKKKSSSSQKKNSNNTTNKDSYQNSIKSVSINKCSKSYNNDINNNIYNNNKNLNDFQNFNKTKKEMLKNKKLSKSKSPNIIKIKINQPSKTEEEKISIKINDIIIIKEKINDLIRIESELEKQKYDIIDYFEFKLKPIRELNEQLIIQNKMIIDKEDELNGQLALLKNQYSQLIIQLNEKNDIINGLNSTYEKEKGYFDKQINEEEENLNNIYNQAIEDLNNGKQIEIDDILP